MNGAPDVSPYVAAASARAACERKIYCPQCGAPCRAVQSEDHYWATCLRHSLFSEAKPRLKVIVMEQLAEKFPAEREHWLREAAFWRQRAAQEDAAAASTVEEFRPRTEA